MANKSTADIFREAAKDVAGVLKVLSEFKCSHPLVLTNVPGRPGVVRCVACRAEREGDGVWRPHGTLNGQ